MIGWGGLLDSLIFPGVGIPIPMQGGLFIIPTENPIPTHRGGEYGNLNGFIWSKTPALRLKSMRAPGDYTSSTHPLRFP